MVYENNIAERVWLATIINEKKDEYVVNNLFNKFKTLDYIVNKASDEDLLSIKGLGKTRLKQLKAFKKLSEKLYVTEKTGEKISSPGDAAKLLMNDFKFIEKEILKVICLNVKNIVLDVVDVSVGSLNSSIVHPREVFIEPIKLSAASIIVAHNHPSGDPSPSKEDINITNRLKECGKMLGIDLIDHVIIGGNNFISLKEKCII